jgi:hypothetical protein
MAPQKAEAKLSILKAGDKSAEATSNIRALMTNQKTPKVRMVSGKVTIFNNTPNVAFTSPMTSAAMRAAPAPVT